MMTVFDAALTSSYQTSAPILLSAERLTLDFLIDVTADASVQWFLEFTSDPNGRWATEIAEEDVGSGVVHMPKVVRDFQENGGAALAIGQHAFAAQFIRSHNFARVSVKAASGTVTRCKITAPFGAAAVAP